MQRLITMLCLYITWRWYVLTVSCLICTRSVLRYKSKDRHHNTQKKTKGQTTTYNALHKKLKIGKHLLQQGVHYCTGFSYMLCPQYIVVPDFVSRDMSAIYNRTWFCVTRYICNMLSELILCHVLCLQCVVWPDCALCPIPAMDCCTCLICNALFHAQLSLMLCLLYIIAHSVVWQDLYAIHCCTCFFVSRKMFSIPYRTWFCLTCSMHNTLCAT